MNLSDDRDSFVKMKFCLTKWISRSASSSVTWSFRLRYSLSVFSTNTTRQSRCLLRYDSNRIESRPADRLGRLNVRELFDCQVLFGPVAPKQVLLGCNAITQFLFLARYARIDDGFSRRAVSGFRRGIYVSSNLHNLATTSKPLSTLTRADSPRGWLRSLLCSKPIVGGGVRSDRGVADGREDARARPAR